MLIETGIKLRKIHLIKLLENAGILIVAFASTGQSVNIHIQRRLVRNTQRIKDAKQKIALLDTKRSANGQKQMKDVREVRTVSTFMVLLLSKNITNVKV